MLKIIVILLSTACASLIKAKSGVYTFELQKTQLISKDTQVLFTNYQLQKYKPKSPTEVEVISTYNEDPKLMNATMPMYLLQAPILMGTPPQIIFAVLDTGSANLLISTSECSKNSVDCPLEESNYYPENSNTHYQTNNSGYIAFLCGSLDAKVGRDEVKFGGLVIEDQDIAEVTAQNGSCIEKGSIVGGIIGLSPPEMKLHGTRTLLQNIVREKLLESNIMSFYFPKLNENSKGIATFGDTDKQYYEGEIKYYPSQCKTYWSVKINKIMVVF
jgi:cathepsin D